MQIVTLFNFNKHPELLLKCDDAKFLQVMLLHLWQFKVKQNVL